MKEKINLNKVEAYSKAYKELDALYSDPERKKFVHYLVSTFTKEEPYYILFSKKPLLDSLTGATLNPVFDKENPPKGREIKTLIDQYKGKSKEEKDQITKRVQEILKQQNIEQLRPRLAVSLDGVRRILGVDEYKALLQWVDDNMNIKTINNIVRFNKGEFDKTALKTKDQIKDTKYRKGSLGGDEDLRNKLLSAIK